MSKEKNMLNRIIMIGFESTYQMIGEIIREAKNKAGISEKLDISYAVLASRFGGYEKAIILCNEHGGGIGTIITREEIYGAKNMHRTQEIIALRIKEILDDREDEKTKKFIGKIADVNIPVHKIVSITDIMADVMMFMLGWAILSIFSLIPALLLLRLTGGGEICLFTFATTIGFICTAYASKKTCY